MRFGENDLSPLLDGARSLVVCKGKKVQAFDPSKEDEADCVSSMLGPTGNLRAPTFRRGKKILVGFNPDELSRFLG